MTPRIIEVTFEINLCAVCDNAIKSILWEEIYWHIPTENTVWSCCIHKVRKKHNYNDYFLIEEDEG